MTKILAIDEFGLSEVVVAIEFNGIEYRGTLTEYTEEETKND